MCRCWVLAKLMDFSYNEKFIKKWVPPKELLRDFTTVLRIPLGVVKFPHEKC